MKDTQIPIASVNSLKDDAVIVFGDLSIKVEIADTPSKRAKGLSGNTGIGDEEGMLFISENLSSPTFWMKDMNFPLDFIWINGETVVDFTENVPNPPPGTSEEDLILYKPKGLVDKVLEVNAGFVQKHDVKIGDSIRLENN